jgi:hypothetical protein
VSWRLTAEEAAEQAAKRREREAIRRKVTAEKAKQRRERETAHWKMIAEEAAQSRDHAALRRQREDRMDFWWGIFLLAFYPVPVILFYWLFGTEKPIHRIFQDIEILLSYVLLGVGTLVYLGYWIGAIISYPESKHETLRNLYGKPLRLLSIGGMWVFFVVSHAFGIFIILWPVAAGMKKILVWIGGCKMVRRRPG